MLFRYKTDPKKANVLQGRQLTWTGLRKFTENVKSRILQSLTDHLQEVLLNPSMARHNGKKITLMFCLLIYLYY